MSIPRVNSGQSAGNLVEREIRRWSLFRVRQSDAPVAPKALPLITLSRQCGSQGGEIGQRVAARLGFEYWSQELVHTIANNLGAPRELLTAVDERYRNAIEDLVSSVLLGNQSTQQEYVRQLRRVLHALEQRGSAVVVGRGAQFVVERALRVRLVAPIEHRVQGFAERRGLPLEQAAVRVREVDRERRFFMRKYYGQDVGDPRHYDLLINTAAMPLDEAADLLCAAYQRRFGKVEQVAAATA